MRSVLIKMEESMSSGSRLVFPNFFPIRPIPTFHKASMSSVLRYSVAYWPLV